jgi:murein DD-endopeptidase MepM/ murein hydrolase activator NlpD
MADAVDPGLKQSVLALFGPAFHVSRDYGPGHDGVDIGAPTGTPLHAIAGGTVSYARNEIEDPEDPKRHWALGGGNVVNIDIPGNRTLQFAHLQSLDVKEGDAVAAGQPIGTVGATGRATGPHVHFGLWDHVTNKMILPYDYLATLAAGAPNIAPNVTPNADANVTPNADANVAPNVTPNADANVLAQIDDVERFPAPRHFRSRPGITLRGFDPARPNQVVRQQRSSIPSGASAAAIVRIGWPGMDPQPVPTGTFLEVVNGLFVGLYIPVEDVDLDPAPG